MKPSLKELLRPPFIADKVSIHDSMRRLLLTSGHFDTHYEDLGEELLQYVASAMNEKWERDYGEPLRWKTVDAGEWCNFVCPKCNATHTHLHDHCPSCGQRLLPPKEE